MRPARSAATDASSPSPTSCSAAARPAEQALGDQPRARPGRPDRHRPAAQLRDRTHPARRGHDQVHVVVVDARQRRDRQPPPERRAAERGLGGRVGGGERQRRPPVGDQAQVLHRPAGRRRRRRAGRGARLELAGERLRVGVVDARRCRRRRSRSARAARRAPSAPRTRPARAPPGRSPRTRIAVHLTGPQRQIFLKSARPPSGARVMSPPRGFSQRPEVGYEVKIQGGAGRSGGRCRGCRGRRIAVGRHDGGEQRRADDPDAGVGVRVHAVSGLQAGELHADQRLLPSARQRERPDAGGQPRADVRGPRPGDGRSSRRRRT